MGTSARYEGRIDATGTRLAVVIGRFNRSITERLLDGARGALAAHEVDPSAVTEVWVPGAFELPLVARHLADNGTVDAVVCLGAVVRGDTSHFDFVAGECAAGLMRVSLDTGVPVTFGVLTTDDEAQAEARSGDGPDNKGYEAVLTALEMVDLLRTLPC